MLIRHRVDGDWTGLDRILYGTSLMGTDLDWTGLDWTGLDWTGWDGMGIIG